MNCLSYVILEALAKFLALLKKFSFLSILFIFIFYFILETEVGGRGEEEGGGSTLSLKTAKGRRLNGGYFFCSRAGVGMQILEEFLTNLLYYSAPFAIRHARDWR